MQHADACVDCLRRSWLLSLLGHHLENLVRGLSRRQAVDLLRLDDDSLLAIAAPTRAEEIAVHLGGLGESWFTEQLTSADCWAVCRHTPDYPASLNDLSAAPAALFGRGDRGVLGTLTTDGALAMVGSRRATSYGREVARNLGAEVAAAGLTVVSGLAFGIDACAHRGALETGRATVAVLGCGPDTSYPAAHRNLWRRITELGAVISEMPPGSTPWRWTFPARSRLIAALSGMTVVVEAGSHSGSLVTARYATDLRRRIGAVPGPVTSRAAAGPNELLAEGARIVREGKDVLAALRSAPDEPIPTYTVVGNYGDSRSPFVRTVDTTEGAVVALALARTGFEAEEGGDLDLRIDALFEGSLEPIDPTTGS